VAGVLAALAASTGGLTLGADGAQGRDGALPITQIDVIVRDSGGRFVPGLMRDDFEVLEEGRPQEVERVTLVGGGPGASPDALHDPAMPLRRVFVVALDAEHLSSEAFLQLRDAVGTFISSEFRRGDVGGLVLDGQMANGRLTQDVDELLDAVAAARPPGSRASQDFDLRMWPQIVHEAEALRIDSGDSNALTTALQRACQESPDQCVDAASRDQTRAHIEVKSRQFAAERRASMRRSLAMLAALANGLGRIEGRKTVILLSEGFDTDEARADLRRVAALAGRSGVAIYSINGVGVRGQLGSGRSVENVTAGDTAGRFYAAGSGAEDVFDFLAASTGGLALRNSSSFVADLARIAADTDMYYVVEYRQENRAFNGKFRRLDVRVRRTGLTVRARNGYLATGPPQLLRTGATLLPPF
jgi:VWFA-related protein